MDVHVPAAISKALRLAGVDVLTAQDDGAAELPDDKLLERATTLGRILFSRDSDLLIEAANRQRLGIAFTGVVYAHQLRVSIRQCIIDLELIAKLAESNDMANRVEFLPLV